MRVLIIEDESSIRHALRDKFIREGFTVFEAKDGEEGLQRSVSEHQGKGLSLHEVCFGGIERIVRWIVGSSRRDGTSRRSSSRRGGQEDQYAGGAWHVGADDRTVGDTERHDGLLWFDRLWRRTDQVR